MSSDLRKAILENISIEELLREEGFEVIPRGRKLTVKGHDSLVITPDKGVFTWNSRGFAGSVIDLYMRLHGCDARTAMTALRKRLPEYSRQHAAGPEPRQREPPKPEEKKPLVLPKKDNSKWSRVYAYLIAARKITPTVVKWLVQQKTIYPDERGNLCYVGRNAQGTVNYCARKGTLTPKDGQKGFRNVVEGSDYEHRCVMNARPQHTKLIVTEAAVDAWSFASMLELHGLDFRDYTYLSLECTYEGPLGKFLEENPQVKTIYLGQDADEAGLKSRDRCRDLLKERQYSGKVIDKLPDARAPGCKDWNDALKYYLEQQRIREQSEPSRAPNNEPAPRQEMPT